MDETQQLFSNILSLGDWGTWENCIGQVKEFIEPWIAEPQGIKFRRVYLVGCGTSFYAGQVGKFILEHLVHIPVEARQAFSFTHYSDPSLFAEHTLVVGVSNTGETPSTCSALAFARQNGARTLAITAVPDSKITEIAQDTIFTGGPVTVIVKTFEYVQSLIAIYLLAIKLAERESMLNNEISAYWHSQIRTAHEVTHRFIESQQEKIKEIVEEYQSADNFFILGNGMNAGTAEEAALKVIEMAKVYSDGMEMEDFFHGRDRELDKGSVTFFLAPQNRAVERMFDFLTFNRRFNVTSTVFTCQKLPELKRLSDHQITLEGAIDEFATPLVYITPLYLFSYFLAMKRGFDPIARRYPISALKAQYRGSEFDSSGKEV